MGCRFLAFSDEEGVFGLTYLAEQGDELFVLYLAVDPARRSRGLGRGIMDWMDSEYPGHRTYLCVEMLVPSDNLDVSLARYRFYAANGFTYTGYDTVSDAGEFHVLSRGGKDMDAYSDLRLRFFGKRAPFIPRELPMDP